MELNIETKQQLDNLLAKPNLATQDDIPFLQDLITTYPFYQPLYLLLAKASNGTEKQHQAFTKAALYNNGGILYRIINEPQALSTADKINVIKYEAWNNALNIEILDGNQEIEPSITTNEIPVKQLAEEAPFIENLEPLPNEVIRVDEEELEIAEENATTTETLSNKEEVPAANNFVVPEIENLAPLQDEIIKVCEAVEQPVEENKLVITTDEQETFEEITEFILPVLEDKHSNNAAIAQEELPEIEEPNAVEQLTKEEKEAKTEVLETFEAENFSEDTELATEEEPAEEWKSTKEKTDSFEMETFASASFFAFDTNFSSEKIEEEEFATTKEEPTKASIDTGNIFTKENTVSKYDDDQLPFTFLWWLAKTRKDHEQIFRPFVSTTKGNTQAQDLQQQYVENIFHIQAPFEPGQEEQEQIVLNVKLTKETEIIDTFIKNDPQIKALPPNQINNENKAKKSAEDSNDLVSETLAQIYIEQTLYHKAIDTYQKLSLKFPEKSAYFADLIQSLEKKI